MNVTNTNYNIGNNSNVNINISKNVASEQTEVSGNALLSQTSQGEVFNGKVVNVNNNQVSIMLENNSLVNAQMMDSVNLNIGDMLSFVVKQNNGSNVLIKPVANDASFMKDSTIFKILDANGMSPSPKNYQIAENLMNNNMPVDKSSMQMVLQQSLKFPNASIDTLVKLNKLGLDVNENSISQYEDYLNNTHYMMKDIDNLNSSLVDFTMDSIKQMTSNSSLDFESLQNIVNFENQLLDIINSGEENTNQSVTGEEALANNGQLVDANEALKTNNTEANLANATNKVQTLDAFILSKSSINEFADVNEIVSSLSKMGFSKEDIKSVVENAKSPVDLLKMVNNLIEDKLSNNSETLDLNNIKEFFNSDVFKKLLSDGINREFTLDVEDMNNPEDIDKLYKNIYQKTNKLLDTFSNNDSKAGSNMQENARNMQERIDFMQNINNMYTYAQIPFRTNTSQANSELFVYMNKQRINKTKEDISALLHLDMQFLGPTDVHVSLHGTNVHTKFYVEDEESAKIIDEHMTMLEKAIKDNGFSLTNEVITREPMLATEANMVVKEMFNEDLEKEIKRYSFDVRM